jgi:hypothetical protein
MSSNNLPHHSIVSKSVAHHWLHLVQLFCFVYPNKYHVIGDAAL